MTVLFRTPASEILIGRFWLMTQNRIRLFCKIHPPLSSNWLPSWRLILFSNVHWHFKLIKWLEIENLMQAQEKKLWEQGNFRFPTPVLWTSNVKSSPCFSFESHWVTSGKVSSLWCPRGCSEVVNCLSWAFCFPKGRDKDCTKKTILSGRAHSSLLGDSHILMS